MSGIKDIWLYANNIIRSSRQLVNEGLRPLNLSSAEGNVLLHLLTRGHALQQDEIVEQLDVSKPAVSRALESLERKGYVSREKDPSDMRANRVVATDRARAISPEVERVYNEVFDIAAGVVSESEVKGFIELFGRVSDSFAAARAGIRNNGSGRREL
ncbi:MAG: MarR family transcriptional regulator [Bacillota bacterium]|nr:MarR family transcriptional regulator [Bacillota bacterium]